MKPEKDKRSARPSQRIKMHIMGSAGDVSGSLFYFEYSSPQGKITRFLLECGLHQEHEEINRQKRLPKGVEAKDINFVIISHAHIDHSGWLPALVKDGFKGAVYTHPATKDLLDFLLLDSGRLQENAADRVNRFIARRQKKAEANGKKKRRIPLSVPLYTAEDVPLCFPLFKQINYNQLYTLAEGIKMRFTEAGHILGAAVVTITIGEGDDARTICFTGNVGRATPPMLRPLAAVKNADYVISESTYGNKLHKERDRLKTLAEYINNAYARAKVKDRATGCGVIVIPAFAVDRVPTVLHDVQTLSNRGLIPNMAVYLDSRMAIAGAAVYRKYPALFNDEVRQQLENGVDPFAPPRYLECTKPEQTNALYENQNEPIIIVGSSGMAAGGKILRHLEKRLVQKNSTVIFVGYQGTGALGFDLVNNKPKHVRVHGKVLPVRATIEYMSDYSGHADYEEIIAWMSKFENKPRKTFLVHGDGGALEEFKGHIEKALGWSVVVPQRRQCFEL
jgi:metallo-beta-lactamase family protein